MVEAGAAAARSVLVVGGGWAGLAAAVELARAGCKVTLFEAARQLGGRARCVRFGEHRVDNGQHIMVGAYQAVLRLLDILGIAPEAAFLRLPLDLHLRAPHKPDIRLRARRLPAPLHLAAGMLLAQGLPPQSRLRMLRFGRRLLRGEIRLDHDITAQALLIAERQDARLIQGLWDPLCLAALNTPVSEASAGIFLNVLRRTFSGDADNADLLIPRTDLSAMFPEPAADFIERQGGQVVLNRRVQSLDIRANRCHGVRWEGGALEFDQVLLAVNPVMCRRLLAPHGALAGIAESLAKLRQEPITTVYLSYPRPVALGAALHGQQDGLGQWVFDRATSGQPGVIAVVISGRGEHLTMDNQHLADRIGAELALHHPDWPAPAEHLVIREKRATFAATPDAERLRPPAPTPVKGLWLAGDFTATGLPATLEGAVASGRTAADSILAG